MMFSIVPLLVIAVAIVVAFYCETVTRVVVPEHLAHHTAFKHDNIVPETLAKELQQLIHELKEFPSIVSTPKGTGFKSKYEHVGEARAVNAKGECDHPLMVLNADRTLCMLADRVDIGRHYVLTGGLDGKKENVQDSVDRLSSFARYTFLNDLDHFPPAKTLFESKEFQSAAKRVCPANKTVLDAFQFNFIVQVPGQTVAMHLDAPYFWGATRFDLPQWLLATMVFSGLFQDRFVDQIQAVAYVHDWSARDLVSGRRSTDEGGEFVYFPDNTTVGSVSPIYRSGTFVDGSKVLHAAQVIHNRLSHYYIPHSRF
jgi:hypothetical protein